MANVAGGRAAVPARSNGFGVTALVLGIVGIFVAQFVLGPLAIIFGAIGWARANRGGRGKALAITGFVLGIIDLVLFAVVLGVSNSDGGSMWHL